MSVAPQAWQRSLFCWFCSLRDAFPNASPGFSLYQLNDTGGNNWLKIKASGALKILPGSLRFGVWVQTGPGPSVCAWQIQRETWGGQGGAWPPAWHRRSCLPPCQKNRGGKGWRCPAGGLPTSAAPSGKPATQSFQNWVLENPS